ncbi:hypothetical protein SRCM100623_00960 [Acetobacter pasteurianus]|uniref:Uncharacterized protein n=1 Tax=Acetobacter pasteurianus TaxID=438 RepID=A0A1A0DC57_ACEPA|nr:hypothetical protein [Acetobacter pasteurianus]OAZ72421.1 hypothetical protein SRCM100623_00960 [Acetobacter pasteurianus]
MKPSDLRKLNTRVAYPWPLGEPMPDDVTGLATDEIIYGTSQIADPYPNEEDK